MVAQLAWIGGQSELAESAEAIGRKILHSHDRRNAKRQRAETLRITDSSQSLGEIDAGLAAAEHARRAHGRIGHCS